MASVEAPVGDNAASAARIAQLRAVLPSVYRTRSSLPALLRSFSIPTDTADDRANLYRATANEAWSSIRALGNELEQLTAILETTQQSERLDPNHIVVTKRAKDTEYGLEKLAQIFNERDGRAPKKRKSENNSIYENKFPAPQSAEDVTQLMEKVQNMKPKASWTAVNGAEYRQSELCLTLKGVMRACCILRWDEDSGGNVTVSVERASCFGLKEEKINYLQSQYSLFQLISNLAAERIARSLSRQEATGQALSNVEELMMFLSDPPLPF